MNVSKFSRDEFAAFVADCRNAGMPMDKIGPEWVKRNGEAERGSYVMVKLDNDKGSFFCFPAQSQCAKTLASILEGRLYSGEPCRMIVSEFDSGQLWPKEKAKASNRAAPC